MPNPEQATHFLDGVSNFVPDMQYHSDVGTDGTTKQYTKTAPVAASATGILSAQSVAAIGSVQAAGLVAGFDKTKMGDWGRAVSIVASGAGTGTVVVKGRDYLGAPMREDLACRNWHAGHVRRCGQDRSGHGHNRRHAGHVRSSRGQRRERITHVPARVRM
jgi:hypothetical protein